MLSHISGGERILLVKESAHCSLTPSATALELVGTAVIYFDDFWGWLEEGIDRRAPLLL